MHLSFREQVRCRQKGRRAVNSCQSLKTFESTHSMKTQSKQTWSKTCTTPIRSRTQTFYTIITIHNSCAWWKCIFFIIKILLVFLWNKSTKDLNYGENVNWHHAFAINIKKTFSYIKTYSKYTYIYTHTYISTSRHFWGLLLMQQYLSKL